MPIHPLGPVVVTGGGSGLGRATCHALAEAGRAVAVWDIDEASARRVAAECSGVKTFAHRVDLADADAVAAAAAASEEALGPISGIAYVAGVVVTAALGELSIDGWRRTMGVNIDGAFYTVNALLPSLQRAERPRSIVVVGSTESLRGTDYLPAYCASKHALVGFIRAIAKSLGPEGITANVVCPGAMETPGLNGAMQYTIDKMGIPEEQLRFMLEQMMIPLGRISDPAEVAGVIRFMLSAEATYMTGSTVLADGGMTA